MSESIKTSNLFDCNTPYIKELFETSIYPWDMLPRLKDYITALIFKGIPGYRLIDDMVLAGDGVTIHKSAVIMPYTIIGDGTQIRPGAYLRGNVITGENCVIGNSCELKNSVLLNNVQVPHYNYVGDSILGNKAHMGAGSICSNLKSDGKNVVIHCEEKIDTHLRKLGGIMADGADVGCSCVLNPGTIIGKNTRVYPLTALRGVYPANSIVKSQREIVTISEISDSPM